MSETTPVLSAVAATAVAIARERAAESERPDRLFDDPLAARFAAAAARPGEPLPPPLGELSAPGSVLLAEHVPTAGTRPPDTDEDGHVLDAGGASWRSTQDDPLTWLGQHGWLAEAADAAALAAAVGRPVPPVLDRGAVGDACAWLLRAQRR